MLYKKSRTKPFRNDETKAELRERIRRQQSRIAALETHLTAPFVSILKRHDKLCLFCVVESHEAGYNCVNVFFSEDAAEEHIENFGDSYNNPEVKKLKPLENKELEAAFSHFRKLHNVVPDAISVFEENERLYESMHVAKKSVQENVALKLKIEKLQSEIQSCIDENRALQKVIEIKKKGGKK